MDTSQQFNKSHLKPHAGSKALKKKKVYEKKHPENVHKLTKGQGHKGYSFKSVVKANKYRQRTLDRGHKKDHLAIHNRIEEDNPPPYFVAVVGPKNSGKSTIIRSLIKHYTKQNISTINGPITVIGGKKRRLCFFEVPSDICSMIDIAKVCDLCLLVIDAYYGFEMETFEFLNILKVHGFPKVIGVLTHLDQFKKLAQVKKVKKTLKHRFWTEIVDGAKLFYLNGIKGNKYMKREIINLARFISQAKFRPLVWKNTHPYVICDRFEDITSPILIEENSKCNRKLALFGFVRGTYLKPNSMVHFMGVGDYSINSLSVLKDPIPLTQTKRKLNEKDKLIYAPLADLGDIVYDKDAIYMDIKPNQINFTKVDQLITTT